MARTAPLQLDDPTRARLAQLARHGDTANLRLRAQAVLWVDQGLLVKHVAALLAVDDQRITRALNRFRAGGIAALPDRPRSGRPRRLTAAQEAEVVSWLGASPRERGWAANSWGLALLAAAIEERFAVRLSLETVSQLLQRHGCRRVRPSHRLAKADPAAKRGQRAVWSASPATPTSP